MGGTIAPKLIVIGVAILPFIRGTYGRQREGFDGLFWRKCRRVWKRNVTLQIAQTHLKGHGDFAEFFVLNQEMGDIALSLLEHNYSLGFRRHLTGAPMDRAGRM